MEQPPSLMAQQIAQAARVFEEHRTGLVPKSVTVVQSDSTLVITLHGPCRPRSRSWRRARGGQTNAGVSPRAVRQCSDTLRQEIKRITGVEVREAAAEIEPNTGTVVAVFTTGTVVQVFLLARSIPANTWNAGGPGDPQRTT